MHASLEEALDEHCPHCQQDHHAKFFSLFVSDMHYVIGDCEHCGYRIEFRRDDLGAGLFMPDGSLMTMKESFKKQNVEHMKERLGALNAIVAAKRPMRFLDKEPIREERERH